MFLITGISPKRTVLDTTPRRCSLCGAHHAYLKRIDHYFSLFFIPLLRVKKGKPVVVCDNCMGNRFDGRPDNDTGRHWQNRACKQCGKNMKSDFKYCPYCGKRV